jgi:hypothetical protein
MAKLGYNRGADGEPLTILKRFFFQNPWLARPPFLFL